MMGKILSKIVQCVCVWLALYSKSSAFNLPLYYVQSVKFTGMVSKSIHSHNYCPHDLISQTMYHAKTDTFKPG